ncbi:peptide chain release factor N(5)-glutamine methyltransferase [Neiella sp. HB171785]|uniref:Release factor glutamine methyltransferase n=1 Tax=Neiella litorisoli TaxID=2771431 RepID=A0A8J6QH41_9GAMM|nr:peptide chain release factor N(5)-glutamine methyltransferase [Neiella litorisoli]MBD1389739.1 peptide chain release factor N(5)-glutamine methyltransferase [Neiella litorisoli]
MRIDEAQRWATEQLQQQEGATDAVALLTHVLQKPRSFLYTWPEQILSAEQEVKFRQLVTQRRDGLPVAHLTGEKEFWSLPLQVNSSTLIPRPDTECLVEWALELQLPEPLLHASQPQPQHRVLDLGTGTGAIALALASERPDWLLLAVDQQAQAVALARANARSLELANVSVLQSDWFGAVPDDFGFDLIVSNPPYIAEDDEHLSQGDVRFEPNSALTSGIDGLDDIRLIIDQAPQYLNDGGWLLLEHGYDQAQAVCDLLNQRGFSAVSWRSDLAGQPRVSGGQWLEQSQPKTIKTIASHKEA